LIKKNEDFPQIIVNSIPAPELTENNPKKEKLKKYINGLKELDSLNVDFSVMVCNTIHTHIKTLQKEITNPILNLQDEIKKNVLKINKPTLVIGTPTTINKLYNFGKITLKPTKKEQKVISQTIFLFNKGYSKQKQIKKLELICKKYKNADYILSGCTETSLMLRNSKIKILDPLNELSNLVIKKIKEEN